MDFELLSQQYASAHSIDETNVQTHLQNNYSFLFLYKKEFFILGWI